VLVNSLDERGHVIGVHVRVDSVTEIGDPSTATEFVDHFADQVVDVLGGRVQGAGVEVSLQGHIFSDLYEQRSSI
jgi:hypothetical protein